MFEGGEYSGGAMPSALGFVNGQPVTWGWIQWLQFLLIVVVFILVIIMFTWDEDMKKFRADYAFWKAKEGMLYQGASKDVLRTDLGWPSTDTLAEQQRKSSEAETLLEAGRDPNLYFTPVRQPAPPATITTAPTATGVAAGFRDRMSARDNEEELAKYLS